MSFNLGQFRRDQLNSNSYVTPLSYELQDLRVESGDTTQAVFIDKAIKFSQKLEYGRNYYVKLGIRRILDSNQSITASLQNSNEADESIQNLNTYFIPLGSEENNYIGVIELVISPNGSYDELVLTLQRNARDYSTKREDYPDRDNIYGRIMQVEVYTVGEIYNVLTTIGQRVLNKIGVQGPPGLLMCINGEDIRVGPSGIYEINNGYQVTFIGFVIQESDQTLDRRDYFILDYQY